MARKRHEGLCSYCGEYAVLEKEHVIPRCIFPRGVPHEAPRIWACSDCNREKSKYDDILRDALVIDISGCRSDSAREIIDGPFTRSVMRNSSKVARTLLQKAEWMPIHSDAGIYLGHAWQAQMDGLEVNKAFDWLMRGLNYKLNERRVPAHYEVDVRRILPHKYDFVHEMIRDVPLRGPMRVGQGIFSAWENHVTEDPSTAIWLLEFYQGVVLFATICNPADHPGYPTD